MPSTRPVRCAARRRARASGRGRRCARAETFRQNPDLDTEAAILELKTGEALVSTLENKGEPSIVQRTLIRPPEGRLGPVSAEERRGVIEYSPYYGKYEERMDR
ncbi:MAG: DUF853 family protein, partial [Sphingopyxis sp.]|nr:DUF853 family protein [Sphingopyxis sp.]